MNENKTGAQWKRTVHSLRLLTPICVDSTTANAAPKGGRHHRGGEGTTMHWSTGMTGREGAPAQNREAPIDYSYVLGRRPAGVRHDPHVRDQTPGNAPDLNVIADLIRDRTGSSHPQR